MRHAETSGQAESSAEYLAALELCAVAAIPTGSVAPKAMALASLLEQRLIDDAHPYWRVLFKEIGAKVPEKLLTFDQTALAIDAAINGQGVAIAARILVEKDVQAGRLGIVWQALIRRAARTIYCIPKGIVSAQLRGAGAMAAR